MLRNLGRTWFLRRWMTATTTREIWARMRRAMDSGRVTGIGGARTHGMLVVLGWDVTFPSVVWVPLDVVLSSGCVVVLFE